MQIEIYVGFSPCMINYVDVIGHPVINCKNVSTITENSIKLVETRNEKRISDKFNILSINCLQPVNKLPVVISKSTVVLGFTSTLVAIKYAGNKENLTVLHVESK